MPAAGIRMSSSPASAASSGSAGASWSRRIRSGRRRQRLQGCAETSFEPGRSFANELDFQERLDRWFCERVNVRFHRTLRCRPVDRLAEELQVLRPLPERLPDVD
jgi:hypothetical protein